MSALGAWSCSTPTITKEVSANTVDRVTVPVAKATRQDLSNSLELAAEFRPYLEVELHAKVAGYLKRISVDIGDRVQAGQLLAVLEVPELGTSCARRRRRSSATFRRSPEPRTI